MRSSFARAALRGAAPVATLVWALSASGPPAQAQALLVSVNGAPITSFDVDQRMKLLRLLKQPATREAALDNLIADKIKLDEISHFTIHLADSDLLVQASQDAQDAKIAPAAFVAELQRSGIDPANWKDHFRAEAEWFLYVKAMNKTLDVSDSAVEAARAKKGKTPGVEELQLRQVVVVVPDPSQADAHLAEANALRARFDGCQNSLALAKQNPNVVVEALVTRPASAIPDGLREEIEKTPIGRLTTPQRSAEGLQMVAVCGKKVLHDVSGDTATRDELIRDRLNQASAELFAPLKARAVIVHFRS